MSQTADYTQALLLLVGHCIASTDRDCICEQIADVKRQSVDNGFSLMFVIQSVRTVCVCGCDNAGVTQYCSVYRVFCRCLQMRYDFNQCCIVCCLVQNRVHMLQ